ncbi:MAG: SMC-Scp complex subunit ScpB [Gammaproteobacteria bacterium]|nr:SMC-Scp complex subunit ScpB [Gammaproteobacteria bacterium]
MFERRKQLLEALLLTAQEPLSMKQLMQLFEVPACPTARELDELLTQLADECSDRGIELKEVGGGYRFQVKPVYSEAVRKFWASKPLKFSRALLETLSLVAYRQPITRAEIEIIRGVSDSSPLLKTLLEKEWIEVIGRREVPGRPLLYGTTATFLSHFNLKSLEELPPYPEKKSSNHDTSQTSGDAGGKGSSEHSPDPQLCEIMPTPGS